MSSRWEVCWRVRVDDGRRLSRFATRRMRVRSRDMRASVAAIAAEPWNGELRLTCPDGRRVWTDVVAVARWPGTGVPDESVDGLWRGEVRHMAAAGALLSALGVVVATGRRSGVLRPRDAAALISYAEALVDRSRARRPLAMPRVPGWS